MNLGVYLVTDRELCGPRGVPATVATLRSPLVGAMADGPPFDPMRRHYRLCSVWANLTELLRRSGTVM